MYLPFTAIHLMPFFDIRVLRCIVINHQVTLTYPTAKRNLLDNCGKKFYMKKRYNQWFTQLGILSREEGPKTGLLL